jgi:type IV pilus assembly protein PilY1
VLSSEILIMNTFLHRLTVIGLAGLVCATASVRAGLTDIASAPLFTSTTTLVKPNVMFVLDDSGSMNWNFMPDDSNFGSDVYGFRAMQCNGLAFNPSVTAAPYTPPVDSTGTTVGNASASFLSGGSTSDLYDKRTLSGSSLTMVDTGLVSVTVSSSSKTSSWYFPGMVVTLYGSSSTSKFMVGKVKTWNSSSGLLEVDVAMAVGSGTLGSTLSVGSGSAVTLAVGASGNNKLSNVYYTYTGSQPALAYAYPGNSLDSGSTFYKECSSKITDSIGKGVFTANIVTPNSPEAQRFADWAASYSTRMLMMKTSLTIAFKDLDDKYRVGFSTILQDSVTSSTDFLDIKDFNAKQKETFYSKINGAVPGGYTPLRAALSKAGRYYAKAASGQTYDPVQYSCQKNFTILSTDGYWNTNAESSGFGPLQLDGVTSVGQQDGGGTERPMYDGGTSTTTTTEKWTTTSTVQRTTITTTTKTVTDATTTHTPLKGWTRKTYALTKYSPISNDGFSRCGSNTVGSCQIVISTSSPHGLSVGSSATISGALRNGSSSAINGVWVVTGVLDSTTYTFNMASRPSSPNDSLGSTFFSPVGCPSGQGKQMEQLQTQDERTTATNTKTTVTLPVRTLVEKLIASTPWTHTVVIVNGIQSSDTTTSGTVGNTAQTLSDSTTSPSPSVSNSGPVAGANDFTPWVNSGAAVQLAGCVASANATTASTSGASKTTVVTDPVVSNTVSVAAPADISSTAAVVVAGAKTTTVTTTNTGGTADALADVAMYYYQTDLRDSTRNNCTGSLDKSVCDNNVTPLGRDNAAWQHMTTYTLSLGMNGTLKYDPNYESQASGDYRDLVNGNKNWPAPGDDAGAVNIDDLWHAAVNGRGRYFSATNPSTLASSLSSALNSIKAVVGSSSAAATSTLQPVEGDNGVYIAQFKSSEWTGDLRAYKIDVNNGSVLTSALDANGNLVDLADWSASAQLSPLTTRKIFYFKPGSGNGGSLREFTYANLTADSMTSYFDNACSKTPALTQCTGLSAAAAASINSGVNMVSFLRGQAQSQYRTRATVLGDIVNSSPVFVGKPGFPYTENGYASYKTAKANRAPTLYVGANDGMLHAFNASTGQERWAYFPKPVMDNLYKLGDQYYESKHLFFVDATPTAADVFVGGAWKTILIGGLNAGGKGYYALDVTDPEAPVALWEFSDSKLGLSYGNPVITKRKDGTWVVAFSSGYNNADGEGHLFVLDAYSGALLKTVSTGAGSAGSPSGLGKINAWIDAEGENLATRFYGGDLLGNVWRFDVDDLLEPKSGALKLAQLLVGGTPQPITTQPMLAEITANGSKQVVVYVGTGQYLGTSDVSSTGRQSIYALKDALAPTGLGDARGGGTLVEQTIVTSGSLRTVDAANPVDWSVKNGWYVDLMSDHERINIDMQLAFNTLTAAGNVPGSSATDCTNAGSGTSWIYQLNVVTGKGKGAALGSMVAGLSTVQLGKGTGVTIVTKTDATQPEAKTVDPSAMAAGVARRSSWRELLD